jgi:predicted RecB family nuclease
MHKTQHEQIIFSPSDLIGFMHSEFGSWMDRFALEYPDQAPVRDENDALSETLFGKGHAHEAAVLAAFEAQGLSVTQIIDSSLGKDAGFNLKHGATLDAMRAGADIIYQAALVLNHFRGYADFLVKVKNAEGQTSKLGDYHYEVWDTKLAKTVKPYFVIQLCMYSEMLEPMQGARPQRIVISLGNGLNEFLRTDDYFYYYRVLKNRFIESHKHFNPNQMPDPGDSTNYGRWSGYAQQLLIERDHLSQIANISRSQIKKLQQAGISSCAQLIATPLNRIAGLNPAILETLKAQASIQKQSAGQIPPLFKILKPHNSGLSLLPPKSPQDVFFDIEGFPLIDGGLEYLWGNTYFDEQGNRQFKEFWAHNAPQEKQSFSEFIHWVFARWQRDPSMHIYHYANYEIAACRKLMGRYGVCEHEVDTLLRNGVFIDLYKIVKAGLLIGESRYSIKNVEHLYRGKRDTEVAGGGDSVVVYNQWRELLAEGQETEDYLVSPILQSIRDYNIDDCNSTQELADWLRVQQAKEVIAYVGKVEKEEKEISEEVNIRTQLRDKLLIRAESESADNARITENMAWTLEFHRREAKPVWWKLFDRMGLSHLELEDDLDCIAGCVRTEREPFKPTDKARNLAYEYQFDINQEFKPIGESVYLLGPETNKVTVLRDLSNFDEGLVVVQAKAEPEQVIRLIPDEFVAPGAIQTAIDDVIMQYSDGELVNTAIDDFLHHNKPRIHHHAGGDIVTATEGLARLQQIIHAVVNLNNSYLTLQGPPGAGKTFTGKHIIAELVKQGKKIGISSNSHKAINNLLIGVAEYCAEQHIPVNCFCTKDTGNEIADNGITVIDNKSIVNHVTGACVVGTTAWGFCREELKDEFDYLFIDEAGQVSVAKLIGMSRATSNIILMGDQMQLGQPSQGTHPAESGLSILDYLLHDSPIIPADMGIFLDTTFRMHSAVNHYISNAIYQGQLKSHSDNDNQIVKVPVDYKGMLNQDAGIIYVPVDHQGNTQASDEEVAAIQLMVGELLGRIFVDKNGNETPITLEHIMFVAPYNHQVGKLKQAFGESAKVGTVDKFQGQEAPIVFFSLCSSDANESARGMDFLFDKHRINVAISRAQCLAIAVGSPNLLNSPAQNIEQMKKQNIVAMLFEFGSQAKHSNDDTDLFSRAVNAVLESNNASVAFLQRCFHIGYVEAEALLASMEGRWVTGVQEDGYRQVLPRNGR